jgi:periplasmic protein TonB
MQNKALFAESFLNQPSILTRLGTEFGEASREFRDNPKEYIISSFKSDGAGGHRRKVLMRFGMSVGLLVFSVFFIFILVMSSMNAEQAQADSEKDKLISMIAPLDMEQPVDMPKADKKAGGGGGGGRQTPTPPSKGQLPKFSLQPPIVAPRPEPQLKPPVLPVPETLQVDPRLEKQQRDDLAMTGLPNGVPGPPSAGPGSGGGMGSGTGGGMGSGDGTGLGPGRGFNTGGGDPRLGGGTNSGGPATSVDTQPAQLNTLRPNYTEEARRNKIQGVVLARILIGADGSVKQVRITRGLPDGLNEEAIAAAYKLRFRPATKGGQPVAIWKNLQVDFNLR